MWPTRDDFRIQASNFDLTNGLNIIRIVCGLFLFPHVLGKFAAGAVSAGTAGFFAKAGFHPPGLHLPRFRKRPWGSRWFSAYARGMRHSAHSRCSEWRFTRCRSSRGSAGPGIPADTNTRCFGPSFHFRSRSRRGKPTSPACRHRLSSVSSSSPGRHPASMPSTSCCVCSSCRWCSSPPIPNAS